MAQLPNYHHYNGHLPTTAAICEAERELIQALQAIVAEDRSM